jgi:hypothetical protein
MNPYAWRAHFLARPSGAYTRHNQDRLESVQPLPTILWTRDYYAVRRNLMPFDMKVQQTDLSPFVGGNDGVSSRGEWGEGEGTIVGLARTRTAEDVSSTRLFRGTSPVSCRGGQVGKLGGSEGKVRDSWGSVNIMSRDPVAERHEDEVKDWRLRGAPD